MNIIFGLLKMNIICDRIRICEKGLILPYNFSTLQECNSTCDWTTVLKFCTMHFLSLSLCECKFWVISSTTCKVMPLPIYGHTRDIIIFTIFLLALVLLNWYVIRFSEWSGWLTERWVLVGRSSSWSPYLLFIGVGREFGTFTVPSVWQGTTNQWYLPNLVKS